VTASKLALGLPVLIALIATRLALAAPIPGDPIAIDSGKVAGTLLASGVHAYYGLPIALPPVGTLRWHEPMPVKPWSDVYEAGKPRPACMQRQGNQEQSEDCLYLNVWTPPTARRGAKLPVIVFIHGGGFTGGSASTPAYSGAELARKGVVTVTLAYRLGVFGYLAHPELTRESGHNGSGDWGSLDQIAGLKWIQHNIAAFGGNPANVLVMGHSAGSESVYQLQASPLAHGLYAKLSGWSGADLAPGGQVPRSLADGEASGLQLQKLLGAPDLNAMRAMPAGDIQAALAKLGTGPGAGVPTRPIVDGWFLPDTPDHLFKAGKQNDVPLYVSATQKDLGSAAQFYESVHTVTELHDAAATAFGDAAAEFARLFPATTDSQARQTALLVSGNTGFGVSNRDWARDAITTGKSPAYLVQWTHVPPAATPGASGAPAMPGAGPTHGSDIEYWLGTYVSNKNRAWSDSDRQLSEKMQDTLIAFAKTGNPGTRAVKVPRYNTGNEQRTVFGDPVHVEKIDTQQIEFLRNHAPRRGAP
jgi:para-nitrobenzyl esterase